MKNFEELVGVLINLEISGDLVFENSPFWTNQGRLNGPSKTLFHCLRSFYCLLVGYFVVFSWCLRRIQHV